MSQDNIKVIANNKKAYHDYFIEDKYEAGIDKTSHEYAVQLKGNQFVWIPCTIENYKKIVTYYNLPHGCSTFGIIEMPKRILEGRFL